MIRTVVLTSRENFVWHSMQEIIPLLEQCWLDAVDPSHHEVVLLNVDQIALSEVARALIHADNVVMACFTFKLCRVLSLARRDLGVRARFIVHLHNQATIACWPFHALGLGGLFRDTDVFISSCSADAGAMVHCFENARTELIPFTLPMFSAKSDPPVALAGSIPFVFVGRISEQKNLHTVLCAFSEVIRRDPGPARILEIYGKEDRLGSPNMGWAGMAYETFLRGLAERLGISDRVLFKGHLARNKLEEELYSRRHVFVSASIHSDENFGMAALASLAHGNCAVLSAWGGHIDFAEHFKDRVVAVQVHESSRGPFLDSAELAAGMLNAMETSRSKQFFASLPRYYARSEIVASFRRIASNVPLSPGGGLRVSGVARRILEKRKCFAGESALSVKTSPMRIFESYADPGARRFFFSYGMRLDPLSIELSTKLQLLPWAIISNGSVSVEDPHLGLATYDISELSESFETTCELRDFSGSSCFVSLKIARMLSRDGLLYPQAGIL